MRPFAYVIAVALQEESNLEREFTASGGFSSSVRWYDICMWLLQLAAGRRPERSELLGEAWKF